MFFLINLQNATFRRREDGVAHKGHGNVLYIEQLNIIGDPLSESSKREYSRVTFVEGKFTEDASRKLHNKESVD